MFDAFCKDFEQFKADLKEKWLDYWETNEDLIRTLGIEKFGTCKTDKHGESFYPNPEFVLSVVGSLEPRLKDFIVFLQKLKITSDLSQIVRTLELGGNVIFLVKKRQQDRAAKPKKLTSLSSELSDAEYLNQIREKIKQENLS